MVEIDGGEAEKIVAAESSNCRHLSSSLVVSWMWLANSKMGQDWIYLFCNFLWAVIIPPLKQRSRSLSLSLSSTSQLAYEATRKEKFETSHGGMEKLESFP
jgi:hypothetical protein